jgi:hypothetical protein
MNYHKVFSAVHAFIIVLSPTFLLAQPPVERPAIQREAARAPQQAEEERRPAKELEKKALALLDEVVSDAMSLKRADNRVRVLAVATDLMWDRDEGRARALAREATDQAVTSMSEAKDEAAKENDRPWGSRKVRAARSPSLRKDVLELLVDRDAKLALEFLRRTSPLTLEEREESKRNSEKHLELIVATRIAESDPQTALQIAEKYRDDKLDNQFVTLWGALLVKDPKLAASLTTRIISGLKSCDLTDTIESQLVYSALGILSSRTNQTAAARNKPDTANAAEARRAYRGALEIVIDAALKVTPAQLGGSKWVQVENLIKEVQRHLPDIKKYLPARAPAVRAKLAQFHKESSVPPAPQPPSPEDFLNMVKNTSADELLAMAAKSQDETYKDLLYRNVAAKLIEQGDTARARRILKDFGRDDWLLEQYFAGIERKEKEKAMKDGKLEEVRKNVSRFKWSEERALAWIELARKAEADKDQKLRRDALAEAREVLGDQIETHSQVGAQLELAVASLDLDPERSFEILGLAIDRFNMVLNAVMTVSKFELKITEDEDQDGEIPLFYFVNHTAALDQSLLAFARKDFDRAAAALKRLQNDVVKLRSCLVLADRVLSAEDSDGANRHSGFLRR